MKKIDSFFVLIESGKADIKDAESVIKKLSETAKKGVFLQALRAEAICGEEQALFAAKHAITATKEGTGFSNRMEIELLLRATATRQIGKALEIAGISNATKDIAIVGISENEKELESAAQQLKKEIFFKAEPELPQGTCKKNRAFLLKAFGITEKELATLADLGEEKALESAIIEKIALNSLNQ